MEIVRVRCACGATLPDPEEFARHWSGTHGSATCCGSAFREAGEYARHLREAHGLGNKFLTTVARNSAASGA